MRRTYVEWLSAGALSLMLASALPAQQVTDWEVYNDDQETFDVTVDGPGAAVEKRVLVNQAVTFSLFAGNQYTVTLRSAGGSLITPGNVRMVGTTAISDMITPIGQTESGYRAYRIMTENRFTDPNQRIFDGLRRSSWQATYNQPQGGERVVEVTFNGNRASGGWMSNIQYGYAGDLVIMGTWSGHGQRGRFVLHLDPANPMQFTGHWSDGQGWYPCKSLQRLR